MTRRIYVDESDNPGMRFAKNRRQFTEILVERDEDPRFTLRKREDRFVARIRRPIDCSDRMVTCRRERGARPRRDAGVEQEFQAAESMIAGSTRSRPTRRRAYTRQARMSSLSRNG